MKTKGKRVTITSSNSFLLLLVASISFSCNQPQEKNTQATYQNAETVVETHEHQENALAYWQEEIELNQGERWEANKATTVGIANMSRLIKSSTTQTKSEYQELAIDLNEEMSTLIQKCTMTGASHDNLHVYLGPLLMKLGSLTEAESAEEGERLLNEIQQHLKEYDEYFI